MYVFIEKTMVVGSICRRCSMQYDEGWSYRDGWAFDRR